jgi:hypothetical protein
MSKNVFGTWISVKEKLPEGNDWVLVCSDKVMNCVMYSSEYGFFDATYASGNNIYIPGITHWMPLPELPIEENNNV